MRPTRITRILAMVVGLSGLFGLIMVPAGWIMTLTQPMAGEFWASLHWIKKTIAISQSVFSLALNACFVALGWRILFVEKGAA